MMSSVPFPTTENYLASVIMLLCPTHTCCSNCVSYWHFNWYFFPTSFTKLRQHCYDRLPPFTLFIHLTKQVVGTELPLPTKDLVQIKHRWISNLQEVSRESTRIICVLSLLDKKASCFILTQISGFCYSVLCCSFLHSFRHLLSVFYIPGIISYFNKMISEDLRIRNTETSLITKPGINHKNQNNCCRKRAVIVVQ